MAKTLIDINEEYLDAAQQALRLTSGSLGDLENEEVMRAAWQR